MLASRNARTGIDIGSHSIKLVRGLGDQRLRTVTHHGREVWAGDRNPAQAGDALAALLRRLGLDRKQLGRVATAVDGWDGGCREVTAPALGAIDFVRALPYEARRFLNLETIPQPVLAGQVLGPAPQDPEAGGACNRVLLTAIPGAQRDFVLAALDRVGIEPAIIDLEPLAGLNALFAAGVADDGGQDAVGLLDLGASHAGLVLASRSGGLLSRIVGPGLTKGAPGAVHSAYIATLSEQVAETITFFRGRFHRRVASLVLAGGGARLPDLSSSLAQALDCGVVLADPLAGFGTAPANGESPLYLTACGLCQWGDGDDV